jgi:hypothetical protein
MTEDEIDAKVEEWHKSDSKLSIWEFIGISWKEYSDYVERKD